MSSLNLNKVILVGRLTAEPELKQTPSGVSVILISPSGQVFDVAAEDLFIFNRH